MLENHSKLRLKTWVGIALLCLGLSVGVARADTAKMTPTQKAIINYVNTDIRDFGPGGKTEDVFSPRGVGMVSKAALNNAYKLANLEYKFGDKKDFRTMELAVAYHFGSAIDFVKNVPGADVLYIQKEMINGLGQFYLNGVADFVTSVKGADIKGFEHLVLGPVPKGYYRDLWPSISAEAIGHLLNSNKVDTKLLLQGELAKFKYILKHGSRVNFPDMQNFIEKASKGQIEDLYKAILKSGNAQAMFDFAEHTKNFDGVIKGVLANWKNVDNIVAFANFCKDVEGPVPAFGTRAPYYSYYDMLMRDAVKLSLNK